MERGELDALRQTFLGEATDHLDDLEAALLALEERPGDRPLLQHILAVTHTFKGAAASLGFHALARIGHAMEDVIAALDRRGAPAADAAMSLLLSAIDAARQQLPDVIQGIDQPRPASAEILRKLEAIDLDSLDEEAPPRSVPLSEDSARMPESSTGDARLRSVRIDVMKLDRMVDLLGEIAVLRGQLKQQIRGVGGKAGVALQRTHDQVERYHAELEDVIRTARMVPIGPWLHQYARAVRDVARAHGKEARLVVEGDDAEADMAMAERLRDPLTHLVRNAVGHGIEPPEVRTSLGKDPTGTVTLSAWHEGGGLMLRIADDGAGLRLDGIAARAGARDGSADPAKISLDEMRRLVFEPGFSTANQLSELSGRGLGLSIVRQRVEALRGSISVDSAQGAGTSFTIRLPLTLATIDGLSVGAGEERYLIPLDAVIECLDLKHGDLDRRGMLSLRGQALPCVHLREIFDIPGPAPARRCVVVVEQEGRPCGLVVDSLQGEGRAVIRPLGRPFRGIPGIVGSTILGDGRVAFILEVATLIGDFARSQRRGAPPPTSRPT